MVVNVDVMHKSNSEVHEGSTLAVRLRTEVFDALMATKGMAGLDDQAAALGVNRSTLFRVRTGRVEPQASLVLKMAKLAGTSVEALFELRRDGDSNV